ncbi:MAG: hypothetical protein QOD49_596, partial [Actinomycetota bacterium]|nr:hypothetical protein [Actinomycetota bacterium]
MVHVCERGEREARAPSGGDVGAPSLAQ